MQIAQRQTTGPIGLTRFLVSHRDHEGEFETHKDRGLVTVICRGCEASFSFLTSSPGYGSRDVHAALAQLTSPAEESEKKPAPPRARAHRAPDPPPEKSSPADGARRLPPPGPYAPHRQRTRTLAERVDPRIAAWVRQAVEVVDRRRRPIALAVLGLAGAYVLIALSLGGQPSSSQTNPPGGSEVPVTPGPAPATGTIPPAASAPTATTATTGAVASDTRTLQTFDAGGPDFHAVSVPSARFQVALPPSWEQTVGSDGRSLLRPAAGGAEIQVLARPRGGLGIGQIADEAAAFLALGLPPGTGVERLASTPAGYLMAVARTNGGDESKSAYIGVAPATSYLVISSFRSDASALVRLQGEGIIKSFAAL